MADDQTAPATKQDMLMILQELGATKQDVAMILKEMGSMKQDMIGMLEYLRRNELNIDRVERELREEMQQLAEETKHHFDVVAENIKHDMLHGALHDRVAQHEDRIRVLERRFSKA
jgi:hypothetical protein